MDSELKRKTVSYGAAAFLLAILLGTSFYSITLLNKPPAPGQPSFLEQAFLQKFSSTEELVSFLEASLKTPSPQLYTNSPSSVAWRVQPTLVSFSGTTDTFIESFSSEAKGVPDYSGTNIQVEGVDEADFVKTDGTYLYIASNNTLLILKAYPPEEAEILSRIKFNGTLGKIFLDEDRLAMIGSSIAYSYEYYYRPSTFVDDKTLVEVYDVSDRSNPVLARNFSVTGNYFDSRMINDFVYLIVSQPSYVLYDTLVLPKIYTEDEVEEVQASEIYYSNVSDYYYAYTTVVALNIQDETQEPTHETFLLGATSCMYVSLDNIYITLGVGGAGTLIYRIGVEDELIRCEASGEVPGRVLNQFSMDEYNNYFRLVTTLQSSWTAITLQSSQNNNVFVLDMNLTIVGKLENIAPGESIYSARFMGDRCYLVTFKKVDPLFVIDLKDPHSPEILGWLKVTGYSDYLHPYDENHIIGVGKETIADDFGDFAWYQGVKISLFDVSDVANPVEVAKYEIGDRGTDSPVLKDHKAFLFDRLKNLLVIPILLAEVDPAKYPDGAPPYTHGDYVWQGAYVFNITLEEGLKLNGRITHLEAGTDPQESSYWVKRTLYIDNVLYTLSDKKVVMHNLVTLNEIGQIEF